MDKENIDGESIFVLHDFLSIAECRRHIDQSEDLGFETFTIDGEVFHGYRDNSRVMLDDEALASALWERAARWMPSPLEGQLACGLNPRFRYYRYQGDESFAAHYDGSVRVDESQSKLTLMVYLSDVATGGETRFYSPEGEITFVVRPSRGKALVFNHEILHEGTPVQEGVKYVLRTDVMYKLG